MVAIGIILSILTSLLQVSGKMDFWNYVLAPIINFFIIPIPLYYVPLAFIVVVAIILILGSISGSKTVTPSNIFESGHSR